jgi:hypothetical protein
VRYEALVTVAPKLRTAKGLAGPTNPRIEDWR